MFAGWENFYLMLGSAAAALIGLLFVVVTLNAGRDASSVSRGVRIFMSPVVLHLTNILAISAFAEAPRPADALAPWAAGAVALLGVLVAVLVGSQLVGSRSGAAHWSDFWFYAAAPGLAYAVGIFGLVASAVAPAAAAEVFAVAALAVMLLAIRNAWDLVTWLAPRRPGTG